LKILVTGAAGFIGSALTRRLLDRGDEVVGVDNHNNYYSPRLKEARIARYAEDSAYTHLRFDITDESALMSAFAAHRPQRVVNLAAQVGVRYSIENPSAYITSNLVGFSRVLEASRIHNVEHLVYASSSSVYGANTQTPYSVHHNVDHPLSLYAATKKANELLAHTYSHLFNLPTTGLRFFTVYGPWGRPDMAPMKFAKSMIAGTPISLYNGGHHRRDFTYVDDIVEGIIRILERPARGNPSWDSNRPDPATSTAPWRVYNIGNNKPIELVDFVESLEKALGVTSEKLYLPLQPGDVVDTDADVSDLIREIDYSPRTSLEDGVRQFVEWYRHYRDE
jgi:UDP-glucuronate 4-epimerase